MDSQTLSAHRAAATGVRMSVHSSKTLKVTMVTGQDLIAKAGSMIAYDGYVQFDGLSRPRTSKVRWRARNGVGSVDAVQRGATGAGLALVAVGGHVPEVCA